MAQAISFVCCPSNWGVYSLMYFHFVSGNFVTIINILGVINIFLRLSVFV